MKIASHSFWEGAPAGDSIIAHQPTEDGWRGLTARGDVLNVRSRNGDKAKVPEGEVITMRGGAVTGRNQIEDRGISIDRYLEHHNRASTFTAMCRHDDALEEIDRALEIAPTLYARYNRAMILLSMGRWREGFAEYWDCECQQPFVRAPVQEAFDHGLMPWRGEDLLGRRIALVHAHGYGDTIMTLRYMAKLKKMGTNVVAVVPAALKRLTFCLGSVMSDIKHITDLDYFCPMLHLAGLLEDGPGSVSGRPYLTIDRSDVGRWRTRLASAQHGDLRQRHIGVAWSPASRNAGDYPRRIELARLVAGLGKGAIAHSVQLSGEREAEALGVHTYQFSDFYDCAAAMLAMDRIVTIDTAAAHLAGAIGHPRVDLLLSRWASWRWLGRWYDNVNVCQQDKNGDWESALGKLNLSQP